MAADFNKPVTTDTYTNVLSELRDNDTALAVALDPAVVSPSNLPTGAVRWTSASNKWQKWSGAAWDDLSPVYAFTQLVCTNIGIGAVAGGGSKIRNSSAITGATYCYDVDMQGEIQSDVTAEVCKFRTVASTQAAAFTLSSLMHYRALSIAFGAGSAVTQQIGFHADASLTGAANNYGFRHDIAAAAGRRGFAGEGTADNYLNGKLGLGTSAPAETLDVRGNIQLRRNAADAYNNGHIIQKGRGSGESPALVAAQDQLGPISWSGYDGSDYEIAAMIDAYVDGTPGANDMPGRLVFYTRPAGGALTERMRIKSNGHVGIGHADPQYRLDVSATTDSVARFYQQTAATGCDIYINNVGSANNFLISRRSNGESWFYNAGTDPMGFYTNSALRMQIDGSGNVLIAGAPTSYGKLGVVGTIGASNFCIGAQDTTDAGRAGFINSNGPSVIFYGSATGGAGALLFTTGGAERARIDSSGNLLVTNVARLGYGAGAGGTVTQATSKTTGVTLNKPCGQITTHNASLAAGAYVGFIVTNSLATTGSTVVVTSGEGGGTPGAYDIYADYVANGSFNIWIHNRTVGALAEAIPINFTIIRGATS